MVGQNWTHKKFELNLLMSSLDNRCKTSAHKVREDNRVIVSDLPAVILVLTRYLDILFNSLAFVLYVPNAVLFVLLKIGYPQEH